ncbi:MAG: FtsX-like permease family protein [Candidatus Saccharibacteria bacterium]|nr:FtsX-like permease family protein [Candidatus Saccharibacteria bacterium]
MKLFDIIRLANSNMWRNKSRTMLTILAIFIGAFTIMLTTGVNSGVNDYIDRQVNAVGAEDYLQIMPKAMSDQMTSMVMGGADVEEYDPQSSEAQSQTISDDDIAKINEVTGIKNARPCTMVSTDYITSGQIDAKKYKFSASVLTTDSMKLDLAAGREVDNHSDKAELVIPDKYLSALGFANAKEALGKKIKIGATITATKQLDEVEVEIVGVQNESVLSLGGGWLNDAAANQIQDVVMTGMPEVYRKQTFAVIAQIEPDYMSDEKVAEIKDKLKDMGYSALTLDDTVSMIKSFFNAITTVLTIFGAIALLAASIGIINTLFMAVQERTREIGLMKSMGLSRAKIFGLFSIEAISLGFWGGLLALVCAYIARAIINPFANETFLAGLPGFTLIEFNVLWMLVIIAIVMAIAFLAGTLPARRAAGKDPIEALRYE